MAHTHSIDHMRLTTDLQRLLLETAHESIHYGFEHQCTLPVDVTTFPSQVQELCASFVTLTINRALRGCIGSLECTRSAIDDVVHNAYAAAFHDIRFAPLTWEEYQDTKVQISILSPKDPIRFSSEAELLRQMRPNVDGLVIQQGSHRATFLPAVWKSLPRPEDFLQHLKRKAGIPLHSCNETLEAWRYTAECFSD